MKDFYPAQQDDYFLPGKSPGKKLVKVKCHDILTLSLRVCVCLWLIKSVIHLRSSACIRG